MEPMKAFFLQMLLPLLAGVCIGIASYQVGKKKKNRGKGNAGGKLPYHPEQMKKQKKPGDVQRDGQAEAQKNAPIFVTRKQCWNAYRAAFYEQEVYGRLRDVYSRDGLLYSFGKLLGIARCDLESPGWEGGMDRAEYIINQEIPGALNRYIGRTQGNTIPEIPGKDSIPTDIGEQEYYRQKGFVETNNAGGKEKELKEELARLTKEKENSVGGKQGAFYRNLWNNSRPILRELLGYGMKLKSAVKEGADKPSQENLQKQFLDLTKRLRGLMEENGIRFFFADEASETEKREYFKFVDQGENFPAVLRADDGYVYYMGQALRK